MYNLTIKELAASSKKLEQAKTEADYQKVLNELYFALVKRNTNYRMLAMAYSFADVSSLVKIVHRDAKDKTYKEAVALLQSLQNCSVEEQNILLQSLRTDTKRLSWLNQKLQSCSFWQCLAKRRLHRMQSFILSRSYAANIYLACIKRQYEQSNQGKNFALAFMNSAANV